MLSGLLAGIAVPAFGQVLDRSPIPPIRSLRGQTTSTNDADAAARLIRSANLGGSVGYVLADAATGQVLASRGGDQPMPPASVAKTITTLFALERLGVSHRFATRVLVTGPLSGGIVQGDLVLVGGGDPTLQTDQLGDLVARLAASGLRGVTGRFLFADAALPALPHIATDQPDHVGYNPAIGGLNLNYNRVHFEWKRGGQDWLMAVDARGERFVPQVDLVRVAVAERSAPAFVYEPGLRDEGWTVARAALGKGGGRWLPVRHPGLYTAEVFRTLARAQGITLPRAERGPAPQGRELGRIDSAVLPEMLREMLKYSTNLTAEVVGLAASGKPDLAASGAAMAAWATGALGITARFDNHSGLGGATRITPADMVRALVRAEQGRRGLKPLLRDYGLRDDAGKTVKESAVKVLAKSGTLNFVSGLAGYVVPPDGGRELAFAIFAADPARRDAVPVDDREDPPGMRSWTKRARALQGQLVRRWAAG